MLPEFELCKGQVLKIVGLHNEPYFKFSVTLFFTSYSGLIQIKKYRQLERTFDFVTTIERSEGIDEKGDNGFRRLLVEAELYFE